MTEHEANVKLRLVLDGKMLRSLLHDATAFRASGRLRIHLDSIKVGQWFLVWEPAEDEHLLALRFFEPYDTPDDIAKIIVRYEFPAYRVLRSKFESVLRGLAGLQSPSRQLGVDRSRLDDYFIEIIPRPASDRPGDFVLQIRQHDGQVDDNGRCFDVSDWSLQEIYKKVDPF
jgi:hypothetical protein